MYLSNLDLQWAMDRGGLIVEPRPEPKDIDTDGIDLHLDEIGQAKIWDSKKFASDSGRVGHPPKLLRIGKFDFKTYGRDYFRPPPEVASPEVDPARHVVRCGNEVIIRPGGFLLWQTRQTVGTPPLHPEYVLFIDGKSARARTGLLVHVTAPTIHAGWQGKVTLELANLGPFDLALAAGDSIAQIRVAKLSNPPKPRISGRTISVGQSEVGGS